MFIVVDTVIFLLLGLYLDNVLPGIGGVRKPWYYFATADYWFPNRKRDITSNEAQSGILDSLENSIPLFEEVGADIRSQETSGECLSIRGLTKKFDGRPVVDNLSLNIYKGQVFVLLGHNGAGKTTTLSMLTGLLSASSGKVMYEGTDIIRNSMKLKQILGVCTQENVFYEKLTVDDHLRIFSAFKGINYEEQKAALMDTIIKLDLNNSLSTKGEALSGGQKRKLSILLSLLGSPKILMLDEPTSSLDVEIRKTIWEIVRQRKKDCVVIMTTHYMDEAEQLGDRIAIMSRGDIKCCGSALFLKKQFHTGYMLTIVKEQGFTRDLVSGVIARHSPEHRVTSESQAEIVYNIPFEYSQNFPDMLSELDEKSKDFGIGSYGVAITSLEDVYLKVGKPGEDGEQPEEVKVGDKKYRELRAIADSTVTEQEEGVKRIASSYSVSNNKEYSNMRNVMTVFKKVWKETFRTFRLFSLEILMPALIFLLAFVAMPSNTLYSFVYTSGAFPTPNLVPLNSMTHDGVATSELYQHLPGGYEPRLVTNWKGRDVEDRMYRFDWEVFEKFKDEKAFGSLYIERLNKTSLQAVVYGNTIWPHAPLVFSNLLTNAFLRYARDDPGISVVPTVEPIRFYETPDIDIKGSVVSALVVLYAGLAIVIAVSSIAYTLVKERKVYGKFQQVIHGLDLKDFWVGRFLADFTKFLVPIAVIFILKLIFSFNVLSNQPLGPLLRAYIHSGNGDGAALHLPLFLPFHQREDSLCRHSNHAHDRLHLRRHCSGHTENGVHRRQNLESLCWNLYRRLYPPTTSYIQHGVNTVSFDDAERAGAGRNGQPDELPLPGTVAVDVHSNLRALLAAHMGRREVHRGQENRQCAAGA